LTPGSEGLLCFAIAALRGVALRWIAFFGVRSFFAASFFGAVFLLFNGFGLARFFATGLRASARFAFGRVALVLVTRRFVAVLDTLRRAAARDVERLRPFVTALIRESK